MSFRLLVCSVHFSARSIIHLHPPVRLQLHLFFFDCSFTRTLVRLFFLPSVTMLYHSVRSSISLSFSLCQFTRPFSFHSVFHTSVRFFASLHLSVLLYTLFSFIFVIYFCQYLFPSLYYSISPSYCPFVDLFVLLSVRSHSRPYISSCVRPSGLTTRLLFCSFLPVSLSARPTVYSFLFASLIAISTVNLLLPSRSSNLS